MGESTCQRVGNRTIRVKRKILGYRGECKPIYSKKRRK